MKLENVFLREDIAKVGKLKTLKHFKARLPGDGFQFFVSVKEMVKLKFPTLETVSIQPSDKESILEIALWVEKKCVQMLSSENFPSLKFVQIGDVKANHSKIIVPKGWLYRNSKEQCFGLSTS